MTLNQITIPALNVEIKTESPSILKMIIVMP
jgi:hypothetical protein